MPCGITGLERVNKVAYVLQASSYYEVSADEEEINRKHSQFNKPSTKDQIM
jgi:hypothetical protein